MTMPSTTPGLRALLEHEQQLRDRALVAQGEAEQAAQQAHGQADQMLAYRQEYEARWAAQFHQGGTMPIVMCYRSFMQRLDQAVRLQQHAATQADAHVQRARQALLARERQLASVRKLAERRGADMRQALQRREQRHNDEIAQRVHRRSVQRSGMMPLM